MFNVIIIYYKKYVRFKIRIYFKCFDIWEFLLNCVILRILNKICYLIKYLILMVNLVV